MRRLARGLTGTALALLATDGVAFACTVCYGNADSRMIDSARSGTFLLLGVVVAMQAAFAAFFLYLRRAARRAADAALDGEWSPLQRERAASYRSLN